MKPDVPPYVYHQSSADGREGQVRAAQNKHGPQAHMKMDRPLPLLPNLNDDRRINE